jgi:hypothetical protein
LWGNAEETPSRHHRRVLFEDGEAAGKQAGLGRGIGLVLIGTAAWELWQGWQTA